MPKVHCFPEGKVFEVSVEKTLLQGLLEQSYSLLHACGGNGQCGTCRVTILEGLEFCSPRTLREERIANYLKFKSQTRLACQTQIHGAIKLNR